MIRGNGSTDYLDKRMPPAQVVMRGDEVWKIVVFADECKPCDMCEEPVCYICDTHYADCECPGPTQDEVDYEEFDGALYGRFTGEQ